MPPAPQLGLEARVAEHLDEMRRARVFLVAELRVAVHEVDHRPGERRPCVHRSEHACVIDHRAIIAFRRRACRPYAHGTHRPLQAIPPMERPLDPARLGDHLDRLYRAAWALCGIPRGRRGSRPGDLCARARAPPAAAQRRRPRLPLAHTAQHVPDTEANRGPAAAPGPLPDQLDVVADPHAREPQAAVEAGELYAAIAALPDDFRDVLVAVDVTGLSYKEAARVLGIREGTVMSRLYRARQQVVRRVDGG